EATTKHTKHTKKRILLSFFVCFVCFVVVSLPHPLAGEAIGNDPSRLSSSQCSCRLARAFLTLGSSMCPSKSAKNTYSGRDDLAGNDSIQVRLSLACLKMLRASTNEPGLCDTLNMIAVLSWPVLPHSCVPMTAKRVSLKGESSMSGKRMRSPYLTAACRL